MDGRSSKTCNVAYLDGRTYAVKTLKITMITTMT